MTTTTYSHSPYPKIPITEHAFSNECSTIANNIRKCVYHSTPGTSSTNVLQFTEKQHSFLLLHMHCETELKRLTTEMNEYGFSLHHNLIYNTQKPYTISVDKNTRKAMMTQNPLL
jgi:hypothetical protein